MNYARINRAIAIAEAKEAEQAKHAERVRAAQEAAHAESNRQRPEPPDLSGGLDPHDTGHGGEELSDWYRNLSNAAERLAERAADNGVAYFPSTDETRR